MNISIFSHWDNPLFENKTNDFQLPLIKVHQFCYPLTIPNVENDDDSWFHLKINFSNFKRDASSNKIDLQLQLELGRMHVARGVYSV